MRPRDEAYQYYFYFIQERMNIFWKRYEGQYSNFTSDKILANHKFTNVYRAQDRVSQFLIKEVIYPTNTYDELDVLFRILLFKVFNNINTWNFLESALGDIKISSFNVDKMSILLSDRIKSTPIFSPAYMMTGSHSRYAQYKSKHEKWLRMIDREMIKGKRFQRIVNAKSLEQVYHILLECSFLGSFLAYQYAIDFNYSQTIDFDENSFVKAGIGALRGIKKCFKDLGSYSPEDCIRYTQDNLDVFQKKYGYADFKPLFTRLPQLIDLQNCFCETDKYLRVKLPELRVDNMRIKQKFVHPKQNINFFFPPKWGINKNLRSWSMNSGGLTLF
jgi:hypothetical protein